MHVADDANNHMCVERTSCNTYAELAALCGHKCMQCCQSNP